MKTIILYYSIHKGNTKKLAEAIASAGEGKVKLLDAVGASTADLSGCDAVGIASGIYAGSFGKDLMELVRSSLPEHQKVFLLYTYGIQMDRYTKAIKAILAEKHAHILGEYSCKGHNTFGPFKLIGGTGKGHPNAEDIEGALQFYRSLKAEQKTDTKK